MNKFYKISLIILVLIIGIQSLKSQTKGSFEINVNMPSGTRVIAFYVPTDYDPSKEYRLMICLHGSGQPATDFRDNLCPDWATFIKNTIYACPEGSGPSLDFYNEEGDETIIDSAISYVKQNYSIDEKEIILEGFSLGARSALKYGLENPDKIKGLLLNTPAMQSYLDVTNNPLYSLNFKYENGSKLPIAITHGASDRQYYNPVDTLYKILTENNAKVLFTRVPQMGHNIPDKSVIQKCLDFINEPLKNNLDADISKILMTNRTYVQKMKPKFRMRNLGAQEITSANIAYSINGASTDYSWSGSISSFKYADIELPEILCSEKKNVLVVKIKSINGSNTDISLPGKKQDSIIFQNLTQSLKLPFKCGFELTDPNLTYFSLQTAGGMVSWNLRQNAKTEGAYSLMMYNTPFFNINQGLAENLLSPLLDLTSVKNPCVAFDLGFNYIKLTTEDGYPENYTYTDTLKIMMSTDNGKTYTNIYTKSGAELATVSTPITNPPTLNDCVFTPASQNQWRTEIVKLNDFADNSNVLFVFKDVSGNGGTLWLDNIRFLSYDDITDVSEGNSVSGISISPNPAIDMINLKIPDNTNEVRIYNFAGIQIFNAQIESGQTEFQINTDCFNSGIYMVEVLSGDRVMRDKLVIMK
ncbi:MAG: T9SS type A sorting domain-containing protein [bacterium]